MKTFSAFILLLAVAFSAIASAATIQLANLCPYPIACAYVRGYGPTTNPAPATTNAKSFLWMNSGQWMEPYAAEPDLGDTIQCAIRDQIIAEFQQGINPTVMQLEYMYNTTENHFYWDVSEINGNPFGGNGFYVQNNGVGFDGHSPPQNSEWYSCWDSTCHAGIPCGTDQVYHQPPDNKAIRCCPPSDNLVWYIGSDHAVTDPDPALGLWSKLPGLGL